MLEILFWLIVASAIAGAAYLVHRRSQNAAVAIGAGGLLLIVLGAFVLNFHLVTGGQVGVALKGGDATPFTGFKITGLGTKVVKFDRSIALDLNVELDGTGKPTDRTVVLIPSDGSQVYLDARATLALDSRCDDASPRRCMKQEDRDQVAGLAVQFRKGGQEALERYAVGKLRERANIVAAAYPDADTMINQKRGEFLDRFQSDITTNLTAIGFEPTLLVVEQLVPSASTQDRLNAIATERAQTQLAQQKAKTATEVAGQTRTEADATAYATTAQAKADAEGIAARGAAYAANPQAAQVDMARAYGEKGNAVVVTNGQAEVRPIVTTGSAQSGQ